jgi:hypothetical protein
VIAVVEAIAAYAPWLLAVLGLLGAREAVLAARAIRERRHAAFGLERESATGRLIRSFVTLLLLAIIALGVRTVTTVVYPALPVRLDDNSGNEPYAAPTIVAPLPPPVERFTPTPPATEAPPEIVTATPRG